MKSNALGQTDEWMVFGDHQLTAAGNVQWPEIPTCVKEPSAPGTEKKQTLLLLF